MVVIELCFFKNVLSFIHILLKKTKSNILLLSFLNTILYTLCFQQIEEWQRLKVPVFPLGPFPADVVALLTMPSNFLPVYWPKLLSDQSNRKYNTMTDLVIRGRYVNPLQSNLRSSLLHFFINRGNHHHNFSLGYVMNQNEVALLPFVRQVFLKVHNWPHWRIRFPPHYYSV